MNLKEKLEGVCKAYNIPSEVGYQIKEAIVVFADNLDRYNCYICESIDGDKFIHQEMDDSGEHVLFEDIKSLLKLNE